MTSTVINFSTPLRKERKLTTVLTHLIYISPSYLYLFKTKFLPSFLLTLEYNGLKSNKAVCLHLREPAGQEKELRPDKL